MDKSQMLTKNDYSKIAKLYTLDFGKDSLNFDKYIVPLIAGLKKQKFDNGLVVDLGSGPGNVVDYFLAQGFQNLTAVDFTPEFISMLRKKYKGIKAVKVVSKDMIEFTKKQSPDSIAAYIASYSIIHLTNSQLKQLLKLVSRSLIKGGYFGASCYEGKFKGYEAEPYQTLKDKRLAIKQKLVSYMNYLSENELKEMLTAAGLTLVKITRKEKNTQYGEFQAPKLYILARKN